jgi:hypothetical protein
MPANLRIWGAEPPQGAGRAARRDKADDVEWLSVTTMEDGSEEWKSSDPAKEATSEEVEQRKFVQKWLRNDPDAREWQWAVAPARPEKRMSGLEKKRAREKAKEALKLKELAVRRLMRTTVKRLAAAVNEVRPQMVTERELRTAFGEFLVDAKKDKKLKKPHEYRQWLWTDRNTVYLAPAGRRKSGGQGAGGRVTGSGKAD